MSIVVVSSSPVKNCEARLVLEPVPPSPLPDAILARNCHQRLSASEDLLNTESSRINIHNYQTDVTTTKYVASYHIYLRE